MNLEQIPVCTRALYTVGGPPGNRNTLWTSLYRSNHFLKSGSNHCLHFSTDVSARAVSHEKRRKPKYSYIIMFVRVPFIVRIPPRPLKYEHLEWNVNRCV